MSKNYEKIKREFEWQYTGDVICPYCGHEIETSEDYTTGMTDKEIKLASLGEEEQCPKCGKWFEVKVETEPVCLVRKMEGKNEDNI